MNSVDELKASELADDMRDQCVMFTRGEYAGFDLMKASRILRAALFRARADELDRVSLEMATDAEACRSQSEQIAEDRMEYAVDAQRRRDELRKAADELERGV